MSDTNKCKKCKKTKNKDEFCKSSHSKRGITNECKTCHNKTKREDYKTWDKEKIDKRREQFSKIDSKEKHVERRRHYNISTGRYSKYGITKDDYYHILETQNGTCAICNSTNNGKSLCIDHNHATDEVRGLLCNPCNSTLGMAKDSETRLRNCVKYLKRNGSYGE